jgi:TM2 domain-containing membrane protein YozV
MQQYQYKYPPKSWTITLLLSIFFGYLGADRFYLQRYPSATLKLCTLGMLGVWWLSDIILIAGEWRRDKHGQPLKHP